ncbi:hypothetical protein [Salinirubrum litoreum]|uniref:Uncharacterized protein n=1 Tax=Salinirubrum litoreum TaxID=1126234 RepID=A0ABD5RFY1_9EURY|nr:hypothetical protein [Salinirubrum litoreum]
MPDDNRFAGIGEQLDDPEQVEDVSGSDDATATDATAGGDGTDTSESTEETEADRAGGPAFAFDETSAKSLYVRDGTLELFEDTEFGVEAALRSEHGIRDLTSREFHDAVVHVAAEHVDEIAAQIDAERADEE